MSPVESVSEFRPLELLRQRAGFVPNITRALMVVPRLVEADWLLFDVLLSRNGALPRVRKELILLALAAARQDRYWLAMHHRWLSTHGFSNDHLAGIMSNYRQANLPGSDVALLEFALRLGRHPAVSSSEDCEKLRLHGYSDEQILEAILIASWSGYLSILAAGLAPEPDWDPPDPGCDSERRTAFPEPRRSRKLGECDGPYLRHPDLPPESYPPFAESLRKYGMVPNVLRAQTLRPDAIEAQIKAFDLWLPTCDILSRRQKECIYLAVSAANLNTYCVAFHCEILRALGVSEAEAETIAIDHHRANLSGQDKALIDTCLKLTQCPAIFTRTDMDGLRQTGFAEAEIVEAIVIAGAANFSNMLDVGLGVTPDFEMRIRLNVPRRGRSPEAAELLAKATPRASTDVAGDPDAAVVAKVQSGDRAAFEELVTRHGRRVQRTLVGILGRVDDVEDAVQDTFVKAFRHLGEFENRAKFSTWLIRIAVNVGLQKLRNKKPAFSLDDTRDGEESFQPRDVRAWGDDPEQALSKTERRDLVFGAIEQLPPHYRITVLLRDIQQLSTEETAAILGLEIPGVKSRLLRARLMLREALAPHFQGAGAEGNR